MTILERYLDDKSIYLNINNSEVDKELKTNLLKQENVNLHDNNDSSIIVESCYFLNSTNSFFQEETENFLTTVENNEFRELKILEFIKIIGKHDNSAKFIREIQNGYLISCGEDNKLIIYSPEFSKIKEKTFNYSINNIYEAKRINNNWQILVSSNEKTILIRINDNNFKFNSYKDNKISTLYFDTNDEYYIVHYNAGCYIISELFSKYNYFQKDMSIDNVSYRGSKSINKDYFALTSNCILPGGKDKLIIYNRKINIIKYQIDGYSFISSSNGLTLISKNENKILLCACKKYIKYQKNGILIINFNLKEEMIKSSFLETEQLEVYCFCQIFILDKDSNYILEDNIKTIGTEYFLVGGFDQKKKKGVIKLFKIIYNDKYFETKIEYIQDIQIVKNGEFKGFKGPVNDIIQLKKKCNILVSCMDGKIYLFKPPNIDYFLFYDKQI